MKVSNIIGIDVSKNTLDAHDYQHNCHITVTNDISGFKQLHKWVKDGNKGYMPGLLTVMEFTGLYSYRFEQFLHLKKLSFVKRSPLDIHRSSGLVRGKTDKADARMIARYGWQKRDELIPLKPQEDYHIKMRSLMAHRELLVTQAAAHKACLTEQKHQLGGDMQGIIVESSELITAAMEVEIKRIEAAIMTLIGEHEALGQNYRLLRSVKGIGFVTAVYTMLYTDNFMRFDDPRKFNTYCGIAPFDYGSGTSIKGRTKVSHLANKKMKSLLHQAAIIAAIHDPELRAYFIRKKEEGKNKMSVYNAIRAKLVGRMFAVIKRQTPFTAEHAVAA